MSATHRAEAPAAAETSSTTEVTAQPAALSGGQAPDASPGLLDKGARWLVLQLLARMRGGELVLVEGRRSLRFGEQGREPRALGRAAGPLAALLPRRCCGAASGSASPTRAACGTATTSSR